MADRSVSVSLRAKVTDFVTGMQSAKKSTQDLSRQMTETGTYAAEFRRRLEAATKALPKIEINADSSAAEIKFAELRRQLEALASKRIGIDVDAGTARAELQQVEHELEQLQRSEASIDVKADIGTALAELRAIDSEVSKVDGRNARVKVDADVAGALTGIATVSAALAALPAVATIGVGVAGLGAAFAVAGAGAGAFAAAALPGLTRVNEALKQTASAAGGGGAGGAMKSAAQSAAEAAARSLRLAEAQDRVADAAANVKKAQQGVVDALRGVRDAQDGVRQAQEQAAAAAARVGEVEAAGARRIADAERSVADAHRATQRAVEDLTRARERAQERLEDLALATEGGALAEERAQMAIRRAQQDVARVSQNGSGASQTDKDEAALRLKEAQFALKEIQERNADLAAEAKKANEQGVEGSDEVVQAKDRVAEATQREADAERAVSDARTQAARDVAAAQRDAADATREVARAQQEVGDAQRKVAEANAAVIKAQRDQLRATQRLKLEQLQQKAAMEAAGKAAGGGGGAASKMAELSKAEKELAKDIKAAQDAYIEWQRSLEGSTFPVISGALTLMTSQLPRISPLVRGASSAFLTLEKDAGKALQDPFWDQFLFNVGTYMPDAIVGLGRSFGNVTVGIAGVVDAFLPFEPVVVGGAERASKAFADWGKNLKDSPEFHEFLLFVKENAPQVWELVQNLATALLHVGEAVGPLGIGSMAGLNLLAKLVAGMDPQHIQLIALAIVAIKTAQAGLKLASFFTDMAGKVGDVRSKVSGLADSFEKVKGKAGGLRDAVGTLGTSLGGVSGIVGGVALTGGLLILEDRFAKAADAAAKFADVTAARGGSELEGQIKSVTDEIQKMRDQVGFAVFDTIYFSDSSKEAADKLEGLESKLADLKHQYELQNIAAGQAKEKVDLFQKSVDAFAGRTDYMQAIRNMETAYKDTKAAVEAANGKLEINSQMTDRQRDAVIKAREQFGGYIQKVADGATAQEKLSGRAGDATLAVAGQLDKLFALAGKSKEAKDQVYDLAQKFGISREQADKATRGTKEFRDMLAQLKSKQVKIELDTKAAQAQFQSLLKSFSLASPTIPVGIAAPAKKKARGGISNAAGVELMASGGIRSIGASPQAMIAKSPYLISGRSGPDVVFGEAGWEAYIPLDASKRSRGLAVLGAAASAMGMAVVPQQVSATSAPSWTSGSLSGSSGASVTITGVEALRGALDSTATTLTGNLAAATTALDSTLGDAGSVTSALQRMTDTLGGQLTELTSAVEGLSTAVAGAGALASAASGKAKSGIGTALSGKAKSSDLKPNAGSKADEQAPSKSKAKSGIGTALSAVAKPQKIQINLIGGSSASVSAPVQGMANPSKISKPVQGTPKVVTTMVAGSSGSDDYTRAKGGSSAGDAPLVAMYGTVVQEKADVDRLAAKISMRVDGRG